MPISVAFEISKKQLLYQESPLCTLTVRNEGNAPVTIPTPNVNPHMPRIKVVEVKTGIEISYPLPDDADPNQSKIMDQLKIDASAEARFFLFDRLPTLTPGSYDITAIVIPVGAGTAESAAIRITIEPTTPRNLKLAYAAGGVCASLYGAWVNVQTDPPYIVTSRFDAVPAAYVSCVAAVSQCSLAAAPIISAGPNRRPAINQWIAWLEKADFHAVHYDGHQGATKDQSVALPTALAKIIDPLFCETVTDTRVRPEGSALVMLWDPDKTQWRLTAVSLKPDRLTLLNQTNMAGPTPNWISSAVTSKRSFLTAWCQPSGASTKLSTANWTQSDGQISNIRARGEVPGRFAAAGCALTINDTLQGAILLWTGNGASLQMQYATWILSETGAFELTKPAPFHWDVTNEIEQAIVRVDADGQPAALIRSREGIWSWCTPSAQQPLPESIARSRLPLDFAFMGDGITPVLIVAGVGAGFRITQLDGEKVPGAVRG